MTTPDHRTETANAFSDENRSRHNRKWIDGKLRRWTGRGLAGGLGSTLMALPALSQATVEELYAFQFAETIPGIRSAKLMENGDVLLKMADGRAMVVAAEHVQVLDSGSIMIAEAAVSEIVEFSAVAEAGGAAAAGGLGGTGAVLGGLGLAGAAAAGGGGGGGGDDAPAPSYPTLNLAQLQATSLNNALTNATAVDGAATVEVEIGAVTKTVVPDGDGNWTVSLSALEAATLPQGNSVVTIRSLDGSGAEMSVVNATVNVDTIPPTLTITGFSAGAVLNIAEQSEDLTVTGTTDAENGQSVTVSVNGQVYTGTVSNGQWTVSVPAADLTSLPDASTIAVTADLTDRAGNPAVQAGASFDTDFSAPTIAIDPVGGGSIDLIDVSGDLSINGSTSAEDAQTVTLTLDGQTYTGTVLGGAWTVVVPNADLGGLSTGTPVEISVSVADAAGNPSAAASTSVPVDLTGPSISIAPLSIGAVLNAQEAGADLTISGTTGNVGDGQQVTVTLDGSTYTGIVTGGNWTVTVPSGDLIALADGGSFTVLADVMDSDGLAAPQDNVPLSKDATSPTLSIDSFSDGSVLNSAEQGTDLFITGSTTAENGQVVTVSLNGEDYTGAASGGAWSVTVPAADLAALADGTTIAVTADVSDAAGNPAIQASGSFDTDFTAPALTIASLSDGATMNAVEQGTNLTVSGTTDAVDGTLVSIAVERADGTVDVSGTATVNSGLWTFTTTPSDLSGLQDQESYTVIAYVTDSAGNSTQSTSGFATDFTAPAITVDPLSVGTVLDVVERSSDLSVSGTTTAENGQTVSVTLNSQTYSAVVNNGSWVTTIPTADLVALSDSTSFQVSATVNDTAGNSAIPATRSFTSDFRPTLSMDDVGSNSAVSLADAQSSGVVVSGSSFGLNAGQSVDVLLGGSIVASATVALDGTWSTTVPASGFSATTAGDELNFSAQATVSGGPDPLPATTEATAYTPSVYTLSEVGRSGSTVQFAVFAEPDRDTSLGLAVNIRLDFDSTLVTFDGSSVVGNPQLPLAVNSSNPDYVNFAGATLSFSDLSAPLVSFSMTIQDTSQPFDLAISTSDGGPVIYHAGTSGSDNLAASDVDSFVRAGAGDDAITLAEPGRDVLVFEADPADNGTDIVTGFTLGPVSEVSDALMFNGLDVATLRGDGTGFEFLNSGDTLGSNTGFVGLTTVLTDLATDTMETAIESLVGAAPGDELYVVLSDGTDSKLIKVEYSAPNSATVDTLAVFDGLNDLSNLDADNILHTDPTGASA